MRCGWISRDDEGRPRCIHGWAMKQGTRWRCPKKKLESQKKFRESEAGRAYAKAWNNSEKGRESKRRFQASAAGKSSQSLYNLMNGK